MTGALVSVVVVVLSVVVVISSISSSSLLEEQEMMLRLKQKIRKMNKTYFHLFLNHKSELLLVGVLGEPNI